MILGIDPGLATLGWARVSLRAEVLELGVFETAPPKKGTRDHAGRTKLLVEHLAVAMDGCTHVVAEALSFPRQHAGVASLCLCWGALIGLCSARGVPLVAVRPQQWELAIANQTKGKVSYEVVEQRLVQHIEQHAAESARRVLAGMPKTKRTHALDAVGVALYGAVKGDLTSVGLRYVTPRPHA